ncbi:MAG: hypothetical protein JSU92_01340 [Deltaproteobacteria bacterium]|nr:MAG: hypothetical protein JSU92_01340 [Deltaproteobacteria bacterium]
MSYEVCAKCGKRLRPGSVKYIISINIIADFDGILPEEVDEREIARLIREAKKMDQETLEREVHQGMVYLLCKPCRDIFAENPLNLSLKSLSMGGNFSGLLQ